MKIIKAVWQWIAQAFSRNPRVEKIRTPMDELWLYQDLFPAKFELIRSAYENEAQVYTLSQQSVRNTIAALFDNIWQQVAWMSTTTGGGERDKIKLRVWVKRNTIVPIDHTCRRFQDLKSSDESFWLKMTFMAKDDPAKEVVFLFNEVKLQQMNFDIDTPGLMQCNLYFGTEVYGRVFSPVELQ